MKMEKFETIDLYIASFPEDIQSILKKLRATINNETKGLVETMSYGMPTFKLNGKNLVHFAAFKEHVGFFPTPSGIDGLLEETKQYRTGKGTLQFSYDEPIPWNLVKKIVKFRVEEVLKTQNQNEIYTKQ